MKFKYYLRGAGVGIFVTVLIFAISLAINPSTMSEKQIISEAKKLGMIMPDEKSETVLDSINEQEESKSKDESIQSPEDDTKDDVATDDKTDDSKIDENSESENIPFVILPGQSSSQVVAALKASELIKDADDFNDWLEQKGYDSDLQPGTFTLKKDMTYEEIAKILTTKVEKSN